MTLDQSHSYDQGHDEDGDRGAWLRGNAHEQGRGYGESGELGAQAPAPFSPTWGNQDASAWSHGAASPHGDVVMGGGGWGDEGSWGEPPARTPSSSHVSQFRAAEPPASGSSSVKAAGRKAAGPGMGQAGAGPGSRPTSALSHASRRDSDTGGAYIGPGLSFNDGGAALPAAGMDAGYHPISDPSAK